MSHDPQVASVGPLLYLFADDVLGVGPGPRIPCRDATVREGPLARLILAATFWELRERGLVSLELAPWGEPASKKKTVFAAPLSEGPVQGLTGEMLEALRGSGPGASAVRLVVSEWFGESHVNPAPVVLAAAVRELEELGYCRTVDAGRGRIAGLLLGRTRLEPDCDRIAQLWEDCQRLAMEWRRFVDDELALSQALLVESGRGIELRTRTEEP